MSNQHPDRVAKIATVLVMAALALPLAGCSTGMNCALFGLQCGTPTPEQQAKAADDQARLKQEGAIYGPRGLYGTPDGPGPQYGEGGGDQYGYGPAYSYARQAPQLPNNNTEQQQQ